MISVPNNDLISAVKSKEGKYLKVSHKLAEMCHFPEPEAMIGYSTIELCHAAYRSKFYDPAKQAEEYLIEDEEALRGNHVFMFDSTFINDELHCLLVHKYPYFVDNRIVGSHFDSIQLGNINQHVIKSYLSNPNIGISEHTSRHLDVYDLAPSRRYEFTPRQWQCLQLLAQGHSASEIATKLFISRKTVEFHIGNMKDKVGVRKTAELIAKVAAEGLL
ncbi:MAG: hypothetical protein CMF50_01965 [Legionellales bacterium]|nr:hypothetical protein [Legionellales bacterium]|tara:strand:+ start:83928 stop:84581 length:654 start_codon:yes stop_codon:yes gene_type:complete